MGCAGGWDSEPLPAETPGAQKRPPACPGLSAHPTQHFLMESSQGNSSTNPVEKTSLGRQGQLLGGPGAQYGVDMGKSLACLPDTAYSLVEASVG